jgi:hypothetical protein
MKTKSRKLQSLPADLRGVADELLAKKFPEPEVLEKKPSSIYTEYGGPTVEFPFSDQEVLASHFNDINFDPTATTTYSTKATQSIIDQYSLDKLQRYRGMNGAHQLTLIFSVSPIGSFPAMGMDNYHFMHQIRNERIDITIMGDQVRHIEDCLRQRLRALEVLYQGYFHCRLEKEEVRTINDHYMYPF